MRRNKSLLRHKVSKTPNKSKSSDTDEKTKSPSKDLPTTLLSSVSENTAVSSSEPTNDLMPIKQEVNDEAVAMDTESGDKDTGQVGMHWAVPSEPIGSQLIPYLLVARDKLL